MISFQVSGVSVGPANWTGGAVRNRISEGLLDEPTEACTPRAAADRPQRVTLLLLTGLAVAHPMGSELVGHRLQMRLSAEALQVDYELELPTAMVLRELRVEAARGGPLDDAAQRAWMARRHQDIENGLLLRFDEQAAS